MRRAILGLALLALVVLAPSASAWTWPLRGDVLRPYSLGPDPYAAGQHRGVDVAGAAGDAVRAPASGPVSFAGVVPGSGHTVTIQADGYAVSLTHLGDVAVARGAVVSEGDPVGAAGATDGAEWPVPYVHLGIRISSAADGYVDPATLLPPRAVAPPPSATPVPVPRAGPGGWNLACRRASAQLDSGAGNRLAAAAGTGRCPCTRRSRWGSVACGRSSRCRSLGPDAGRRDRPWRRRRGFGEGERAGAGNREGSDARASSSRKGGSFRPGRSAFERACCRRSRLRPAACDHHPRPRHRRDGDGCPSFGQRCRRLAALARDTPPRRCSCRREPVVLGRRPLFEAADSEQRDGGSAAGRGRLDAAPRSRGRRRAAESRGDEGSRQTCARAGLGTGRDRRVCGPATGPAPPAPPRRRSRRRSGGGRVGAGAPP